MPLSLALLAVYLVLVPTVALGQEECIPPISGPALDHVVLAVRDLDAASAESARLGFRLKDGRLHSNNLRNRHIKFRDGTSVELMSLSGPPGDALARGYEERIENGVRGAYVAFRVETIAKVDALARRLGLQATRTTAGPWRFLGFQSVGDAGAVFFVAGLVPPPDPDSLVTHRSAAIGLAEVWVEGGQGLERLLQVAGAVRCGERVVAGGRAGTLWHLSRGSLVVVPGPEGRLPSVLGLVLAASGVQPEVVLQGVVIRFR